MSPTFKCTVSLHPGQKNNFDFRHSLNCSLLIWDERIIIVPSSCFAVSMKITLLFTILRNLPLICKCILEIKQKKATTFYKLLQQFFCSKKLRYFCKNIRFNNYIAIFFKKIDCCLSRNSEFR
jgi:hypothetical protein